MAEFAKPSSRRADFRIGGFDLIALRVITPKVRQTAWLHGTPGGSGGRLAPYSSGSGHRNAGIFLGLSRTSLADSPVNWPERSSAHRADRGVGGRRRELHTRWDTTWKDRNDLSKYVKPFKLHDELFLPIRDYPYSYWRGERGDDGPVRELTILARVCDIADYVIKVKEMSKGKTVRVLYHR